MGYIIVTLLVAPYITVPMNLQVPTNLHALRVAREEFFEARRREETLPCNSMVQMPSGKLITGLRECRQDLG